MNKAELLSYANKGKVEIGGVLVEVIVRPSSFDGTPWIEIHADPLSPLHQPLVLGGKWVEYITEEEVEELPQAIEEYKRKADEFCEQAKTVVKAKFNPDGTFTFTDVPEKVQENLRDYPSALKKWLKERHHIVFINDEKEEWYAAGHFTLDLDGVLYEPHWSYWLDRAYYIADEQIKQKG